MPKGSGDKIHEIDEMILSNVDASTIDVKFEFQGPKRTSDERHYFKTVQDNYADRVKGKKSSLSELLEQVPHVANALGVKK